MALGAGMKVGVSKKELLAATIVVFFFRVSDASMK